jgi:hypothetical protein
VSAAARRRPLARRPWPWLLAAALLGYAAFGFWVVPRLVANGVRGFVATHYHREAAVGPVAFNPFTLALTLGPTAIPDADGGPLVAFDRLYVRVAYRSLLAFAPALRLVEIDRPRLVVVRRAGGTLNVMDLALPADPHSPPPDPRAPPPRLAIDEFAISAGEASIVDRDRPEPLTLTLRPITFRVHNFNTRAEGNGYALDAESTRGEALDWHGTFGLAPLESRGTFSVRHVRAATLAELAAGALPFDLSSGLLDARGSYALAPRDGTLVATADVAELAATALGIRAHGDATDSVQLPKLLVTDVHADLGARTLAVGHVQLESPHVVATRAHDGSLSLARLAPAPAPAAPSAPAARPAAPVAAPFRIAAPDIRIVAGDIAATDRVPARAAALHVAPLDVTIGGFALPAAGPLAIHVAAALDGGGQLAIDGSVDPTTLAGRLRVDASALPLALVQPYVDEFGALDIKAGTAALAGTVAFGTAGDATFDGSASIDGLATVDQLLAADFIKWKSVRIAGLRLTTRPLAVAAREVDVDAPYARVIIEQNGTTNLKTILTGGAAPAANAVQPTTPGGRPGASPPAVPVSIGAVRITGATADFADFSIKPNFATGIQELSGTVTRLSDKPDSRAQVDLAGKVDRYAPVTIKGEVNPLAAIGYSDVTLAFRNLELTGLSPYSGRFVGYKIERGKLSVDLRYHVEQRRLEGRQKIVVEQLQLGEHVDSPDATSLPVRLAIALLKDRNGVIDLEDLPLSGSLDDPEFKIGPLVWKVVENVLVKAVTAPFAALGALFGSGEEASFIEFAAGSAALDDVARQKLQAVAKGLDMHPAVNVDVPQLVVPELDAPALAARQWRDARDALARTRLGARATDAAVAQLLATPKDYRALLDDAYRQAFGRAAAVPAPAAGTPPAAAASAAVAWLEDALRGRISVASGDLDALGAARAAAVQSALLDGTGIDPERVFVITPGPPAKDAPLRMQLAMH